MTPPLRLTSTLDVCIAAAIAVWAIVETLLLPNQSAAQLVFALVISIPLAVRRSFPALVMSFIAAALVVHAAAAGSPDATFNPFPSLLVMTFTVGERTTNVRCFPSMFTIYIVLNWSMNEKR